MDIQVRGAEQFRDLARALKEAGDKELRRELYRGIERAMKPMKTEIREHARDVLPHEGGLADHIADNMKFSTRKRAGKNAGISLRAKNKGIDLRSLNRGRLRHPVFGNRRVWVSQTVPSGWFEEGAEREADAVRREVVQALDDVAQRIVRQVR